jgi:hypothetical protein
MKSDADVHDALAAFSLALAALGDLSIGVPWPLTLPPVGRGFPQHRGVNGS